MINIAEILENYPRGTKLYSPIFGDVYLESVRPHISVVVTLVKGEKDLTEFLYDGRYGMNGECMLFPSKENRDWNTFRPFKDGDIISNASYIAIFHKFGKPKACRYDKVVYYHCWCYQNGKGFKFEKDYGIGRDAEYRFATDEEKQKLFNVIKENGYKWNPETKTLEKLIIGDKIHPWTIQDAKDGDVIFYDDGWTCIFKRIHGIWYSSYCFITSDGEFNTGYEEHAVDSTINGNAHPATKEQCNLLFQKMKEAGYKWNSETKTLEKLIEPKFKVGDEIVRKNSISNSFIVNSVSSDYYGLVLPDRTGIGVLNVSEQDEWEVLFNITPKFKSGDKIVKKNDPTECWYVQGNIDSYCGSYHYNIVTKSKFANLYLKDQDDWELAPTPKFKVGDIVETKRNKLFDYKIIKITDTHYTLESIPGANTYDILICEDENWKLVPTHKFKVGDKIAYQDIVYSIVGIDGGYYSVKSIIGEIGLLPIFGENAYKLIPKKFDISTLKVYDKVLVRDDNNSTWVNAFFGFCDPVTVEKYPFVASAVNWAQCIPYEGNEHLLGTCDDCDEYYKNW